MGAEAGRSCRVAQSLTLPRPDYSGRILGYARTLAEKLFLRGPSGGAASASRVGSPPAPVAASADLTPAMQNRGTDPE